VGTNVMTAALWAFAFFVFLVWYTHDGDEER
jgi:hypothetical protein